MEPKRKDSLDRPAENKYPWRRSSKTEVFECISINIMIVKSMQELELTLGI